MSLVPLYKNEATRLPLPSSNHPPPLSLVTTTQTKASSNAAVKVPRDGDALFLSPPVKTEKSKQRKVESQLSSNSSQGRLPIVTPAQIDRNATSPTSSRSEESSSAPTRQDGNNGLILACLALPDKTQLQVVTYADRKEAMKRNSFGEIVYNLICEAEAKDPAMMRWVSKTMNIDWIVFILVENRRLTHLMIHSYSFADMRWGGFRCGSQPSGLEKSVEQVFYAYVYIHSSFVSAIAKGQRHTMATYPLFSF